MTTPYPRLQIVSNTGPFIALEKLPDGPEFIRKLYKKIIVPSKVIEELILKHSSEEAYFKQYPIQDLLEIKAVVIDKTIPGIEKLDDGEMYAISLANSLHIGLLVEDRDAIRTAFNAGISTSTIALEVVEAYKQRVIAKIEALEKLQHLRNGNRFDDANHMRFIAFLDK